MTAIADAGGSVDIEGTLTDREIRVLTERLVVLDRDVPGLFTVFPAEGTEYPVDIHEGGVCTCPDVEFNDPDDGCKSVRGAVPHGRPGDSLVGDSGGHQRATRDADARRDGLMGRRSR